MDSVDFYLAHLTVCAHFFLTSSLALNTISYTQSLISDSIFSLFIGGRKLRLSDCRGSHDFFVGVVPKNVHNLSCSVAEAHRNVLKDAITKQKK